ncbi:MAG: tellurite resistance TerB family protein [Gammaproteobacteria bacterium]|nr:tellurite resistance TerB family protein [Gammaproteobacteria bacterium]
MSNLTNILGSLIQSGLSSSSTQRMQNTLGAGGQSSSGGISDILGSLMGGNSKQSGSAGSSPAGGLGSLLSGALGQMSSLGNNKVAAGGLGALMGSLLGGGGDSAKGAMGGGVMAMLASLAFSSLRGKDDAPTATQTKIPVGLLEDPTDEEKAEVENEAGLTIRAMLNAAKADGQIDPEEMQRIVGKLQEGGIDDEERQLLQDEIQKPFDLDGLVKAVGNNSQLAAQVYIASLLAIEIDTDAERQYVKNLATGLNLSDQTVSNIKMAMGIS